MRCTEHFRRNFSAPSFLSCLLIIAVVLFLLTVAFIYPAYKTTEIFNNAKRLHDDYAQKLKAGNKFEAITAGEKLAEYLEENREILDNGTTTNWASDVLIWINANRLLYDYERKAKSNNITNAIAAEKRLKLCMKSHREVHVGEHAVMLGNVTATEVVLSLSEP